MGFAWTVLEESGFHGTGSCQCLTYSDILRLESRVCMYWPWEHFSNFQTCVYRQGKGNGIRNYGREYGRIVGMKEDEPETSEMAQKSSGATYTVNSCLQCRSHTSCSIKIRIIHSFHAIPPTHDTTWSQCLSLSHSSIQSTHLPNPSRVFRSQPLSGGQFCGDFSCQSTVRPFMACNMGPRWTTFWYLMVSRSVLSLWVKPKLFRLWT